MAGPVTIEKLPVGRGPGTMLEVGDMGTMEQVTKIPSVGSNDGEQGVHIAGFPCPKKNDAANIAAEAWVSLGLTSIALLATLQQIEIAKDQYEIAKRYWQMARDRWDFFVNTYIPCEKNEISEIYQGFQSDYCTTGEGSSMAGQLIQGIFAGVEQEITSLFQAMCICPSPSIIQQVRDGMFTVSASLANHGDRFDEKWCDTLEDLWWSRLIATASRGRNLASQAESFSKMAQSTMDSYSGLMGQVANDLSYAANYIKNGGLRDVMYPERNVLSTRDAAQMGPSGEMVSQPMAGYVGGSPIGMYGEYARAGGASSSAIDGGGDSEYSYMLAGGSGSWNSFGM